MRLTWSKWLDHRKRNNLEFCSATSSEVAANENRAKLQRFEMKLRTGKSGNYTPKNCAVIAVSVVSSILITASFSLPAFAANPQGDVITSIYHGGSPYMTVRDDGKGSKSENPPGLYRRTQAGWQMLVAGSVLFDKQGEPALQQLALSKTDNRREIIAVVNGEISLLTSLSDLSKPDTYKVIGSKQTPLFESSTMQRRFLPKIKDAKDFAVFQDEVLDPSGYQLILVSVRLPEASVNGEGMTIALGVKPSRDSETLELFGKPIVLDYDFHESPALQKMVTTAGNQKVLYSKLLVHSLANHEITGVVDQLSEHYELIRAWLVNTSDRLSADSANLKEAVASVAFNMTTQTAVRNIKFSQVYSSDPGHVTQEFSPVGNVGSVNLNFTGVNEIKPGFIDLMADGKTAQAWTSKNDGQVIMWSLNGISYLNYAGSQIAHQISLEKTPFVSAIPSIAELVKNKQAQLSDFHFLDFSSAADEHGVENFFIIYSARWSIKGQTKLYETTASIRIRKYPDGNAIPDQPVKLLDFYMDENLLLARVHETQDVHIPLLFDTVTPSTTSLEAYRQIFDDSKPKLNIISSINGHNEFRYTRAASEVEFESGLRYAKFDSIPNVTNPSGIYGSTEVVTGNESNRVLGEVLIEDGRVGAGKEPAPNDYVLAKLSLVDKAQSFGGYDSDYSPEMNRKKLLIFAVDASHSHGKTLYTLAVANNYGIKASSTRPDSRFNTRALTIAGVTNTSFEFLRAVRLFRGKGKNSNFVAIVTSRSDTVPNANNAVTMATIIDIEDVEAKTNPAHYILERSALDEAAIDARVVFSEEGVPFFSTTPDLAQDSHLFTVTNMFSGASSKPNQSTGIGKVKFAKKSAEDSYYSEDSTSYLPQALNWRAYSEGDTKKRYPNLGRAGELAQFDSFRDLQSQLNELASLRSKPERMIIVVPQALRELVWDFMLTTFYTPAGEGSPARFSYSNQDLNLRIFDPEKSKQDTFFANFDVMNREAHRKSPTRPMVLARFDELLKAKQPTVSDTSTVPFHIKDVSSGAATETGSVNSAREEKLPHALYLMAAGGPVDLDKFKKAIPEPDASMVIVATPEEMKMLETEAASEVDYGMMNAFSQREIKNPDQESMSVSLGSIFQNPDVQSFNYKFSAKEIKPKAHLTEQENFEVVIDYAVSRFQSLVEQKKLSLFEAFMRFRSAFAASVLNDRQVRKSRLVDKFFVERVLTQVFDIPMNLNTLPEDDPMRLLDRRDATLKLQEAGYAGPFDLKSKVIRTILSQTLADAGKPIPSSTILFGDTGSGKTFLFKSLLKMLNIKPYDFGATDNSQAGAIIINIGKIKEEGGNNTEESMDVEQAIFHLNNFLAQPNGYRGWILIDDAHAAPNKVKSAMLTWLRGMFEAPNGMYTVNTSVNRQNVVVRRPIRNLNFFMTLNPTADQQQIAKYSKDPGNPTTEEVLLATLSTESFKIEPSFLRRWGSIINLDYMPVGAKGPELINSLGKASQNLLNSHSRIALVDPQVIGRLVSNSEKLDARTFLSASTSSLVQTVAENHSSGAIAMVVPASNYYGSSGSGSDMHGIDPNTTPSEIISKWVSKNTRVLSLDGSLEGNLALLKLVTDAYRIPVYEFLITSLLEDVKFSGDEFNQRTVLAPALAAIEDHLRERSAVPLSALQISASDFNMRSPAEREVFKALVARISQRDKPFFPIHFSTSGSTASTFEDLLDEKNRSDQGRGRNDVLFETTHEINLALSSHLARIMRTDNLDKLTTESPATWLNSLTSADDQQVKKVGKDIANILWAYIPKMFDQGLVEYQKQRPELSTYSAVRLFLYALDRGVVGLPWIRVNRFLLKSLEAVAEDQVLSQQPGVQNFLFGNRYRLVKPTIPDLTFQMIANSPSFNELSAGYRARLRSAFDSDCESYLIPPNE
jgi:hypothetical protein